jgi:hypothetical protein
MSVAVIIPHGAADGPERTRARHWVAERYESLHGLPVTFAQCPTPEWSKGAAVNPVAATMDAETLVIADADSFVSPEALTSAIGRAESVGWGVVHSTIRRLTREASEVVMAGGKCGRLEKAAYMGVAGGGIVVVTRETYDRVPLDPRFAGWGGEDHAWGLALTVLVGTASRRPLSPLWHLWHPPQPTKKNPTAATRDLVGRYKAARRDPALMAAIVQEVRSAA